MIGKLPIGKRRLSLALLAGVLALLAVLAVPELATAEELVRIAKPAPAFALKNLQGNEVKLSDFAGQGLIVVFLASWDKNSKTQVPVLIELQREYGGKQFTVLGISVDSGSDAAKRFVAEHKINFPILMFDFKVIQDFGGLNAIPTSYLIDKNQNIINKYVGWVEKDAYETDLKAVLAK